jgi:hypothetical protein
LRAQAAALEKARDHYRALAQAEQTTGVFD